MSRRRGFRWGRVLVVELALALSAIGCGVGSPPLDDETNRGSHVALGSGDAGDGFPGTPVPQPPVSTDAGVPGTPAPVLPLSTDAGIPGPTGAPRSDPGENRDEACFTVSPRSGVDFGKVALDTTAEVSVVLKNACDHPVAVVGPELKDASSRAFALAEPQPPSVIVAAGATRSIVVRFRAEKEGRAANELLLTTSSGETPSTVMRLQLTAEGTKP